MSVDGTQRLARGEDRKRCGFCNKDSERKNTKCHRALTDLLSRCVWEKVSNLLAE